MTAPLDERSDTRPGVAPTRRVVLLGASNLTRSIARVLAMARGLWGGPLAVLAALGHGRSYGGPSQVLGRELPGVIECGLWDDLAAGPQIPTAALVTDIGNDLMYEQPVERIIGWVDACLERLAQAQAETVVTLLPLENLPGISRARFYFYRTLLVPRCRLTREEMIRRAEELDDRIRQSAAARGFTTVRPRQHWYGLDPIHIRLGRRTAAWREILQGWNPDASAAAPARPPFGETLYLRTRTPLRRRLWGFEQRGPRPSATLADGTTVTIY